MPTAQNRGVDLYYQVDGEDETVVFIEDLGYGGWLWGWQFEALAGPFETLVWDLRGTGRSDAPDGPYTVAGLAADLEAVLSDHGVREAHLVGSGLGGMVALEYAMEYGRATSLSLFGTAAAGEEWDADARDAAFASPDDPSALRDSLSAVLSGEFRENHPDVLDGIAEWRAEDDADPDAWKAQVAAVEGFDLRDRLYEMTLPTLVVHGEADRVVPLEAGRDLAEGLPRGEFESFPGAGHLVFVERSRPVNDLLAGFLEEHTDRE